MPMGPPMKQLLVLALLLGPTVGSWHKLHRVPQDVKAFDRSVLGNLRNAGEVANPRMSRSHMFVADMTVGTPPQTLTCLLDSASADIWVPSTRCKNCGTEHAFRTNKSSTFMPAIVHTPRGDFPQPVEVDDSGGQIVGFIVQDRIGLGPWVFDNQSFLIVEESNLPSRRAWDGICGLGWKGMASSVQPLYRNLQQHHGYATFALVPSPTGWSYLVVGEVPDSLNHAVTWAAAEPIEAHAERSFWCASGSIGTQGSDSIRARFVVDTGTSFIMAPRKQYATLLRRLLPRHLFDHLCGADPAGDNLIVCDCAITEGEAAKNVLTIYLGDQAFPLPVPKLFRKVPTRDGGELCLLHVQQNSMTSVNPLELLNALLGGGLAIPGDSAKGGAKGAVPPPAALLAPFLMPAGGAPQVEEITETRPDGKVCTTTLVWVKGDLKENRTHCQERRLQMPFPGIMPEDALSEVWVLGGAFLEHFVTVLDFENKRLGFGLLDDETTSPLEARFMRPGVKAPAVEHTPTHRLGSAGLGTPPDRQGGSSSVWSALFLGALALGLAGGAAVVSRKMRTRKDLTVRVRQEEGEGGSELWEEVDHDAAVAE